MHNNTPKEPIPPRGSRPLQQSMFVDHYQPINLNTSNEQLIYNPMKRSLMENSAPVANQYQFRTQPQQVQNQPNTNFTAGYQGPPFSLIHHSNSASNIKPLALMRSETMQESKPLRFDKPDQRPPSMKPKSSEQLPSERQTLVAQILNQIKQKHLPPLVNLLKKELFEEMNQLKQELLGFRQQMRGYKVKQEALNIEQSGKENSRLGDVDLVKDFFLLEGKVKQLEARMGEDMEKILGRLQEGEKSFFKVGVIRSSLSPIMLEYKESLSVRGRGSSEQKITLSTCHYYIDKGGYLMDSESRYLVDRRGNQIRLQDKHLRLLEKHKILYK